ncbi:MAG: NAD(P)-dependent oxidoreductase [Rhodoferax sp.]|nr:NAD(P)-dependent oxidoreductase [Rhodoferax sp.]
MIRSKTQLDLEFFDAAPNLRFVGRAGAGMDQIDLEEANRRNIKILNAPEGNRDAVGEHVVGQLLCLFNQLSKANWEVRNKIWNREGNRGVELKDKTAALIGYGHNGQATAKKLSGFDCKRWLMTNIEMIILMHLPQKPPWKRFLTKQTL